MPRNSLMYRRRIDALVQREIDRLRQEYEDRLYQEQEQESLINLLDEYAEDEMTRNYWTRIRPSLTPEAETTSESTSARSWSYAGLSPEESVLDDLLRDRSPTVKSTYKGHVKHTRYNYVLANGVYEIYGPYNAHFITELKRGVPTWSRYWDRTKRCWTVGPSYLPFIERLCNEYNDKYCIPMFGGEPRQPTESLNRKAIKAISNVASNREYKIRAIIDLMDDPEMRQMVLLYLECEDELEEKS